MPHPTDHPYHWVRDPEGWFHWDFGNGQVMKSRLTPIDTTSMSTWANTLVQSAQDTIDYGFGLCFNGTNYDLRNYIADTLVGRTPWQDEGPCGLIELYKHLVAHPNFVSTMTSFKAHHGEELFPLTFTSWHTET